MAAQSINHKRSFRGLNLSELHCKSSHGEAAEKYTTQLSG